MATAVAFEHHDLLDELNRKNSVSEKLAFLHRVVQRNYGFVHRIGVAVYDQKSDCLKTFAHSTDGGDPLPHYQCRLSEAKSLYRIFVEGKPRVVNDLRTLGSPREHSRRLLEHGFRSGYTIPTYHNDRLAGFVFFNSREPDVFREEVLPYLDMIARLVSLLVCMELQQVQTLYGALKMASSFSGHKDPETGAHLERMARFSHLIASHVAAEYGLSDETIEAIFWFAPMHDVGKIAIPDHILRKPGKLTSDEFSVMKTHATRGREIINAMLANFNLEQTDMASMIGNIAEFHHENIDGSGYPKGLKGEEIPIEARIIAVADVFDALTSRRCYKSAWSNDEALAALKEMSRWKLDRLCVEALCAQVDKIVEIQGLFEDEPEGRPVESKPSARYSFASVLDSVK